MLLLIVGVVVSSVITGFPFSRLKSYWIARGGTYDRNAVVSELHYYYNYPGQRSVIVEGHGKTVRLNFLDENLKSVRRGFFARHRDDFKRYYEAGFDTMIVEARKETGGTGTIEYDLSYYRFR